MQPSRNFFGENTPFDRLIIPKIFWGHIGHHPAKCTYIFTVGGFSAIKGFPVQIGISGGHRFLDPDFSAKIKVPRNHPKIVFSGFVEHLGVPVAQNVDLKRFYPKIHTNGNTYSGLC